MGLANRIPKKLSTEDGAGYFLFIIRNAVIHKTKKNHFLFSPFVMLNKLMALVGSVCIYRVDSIRCPVIVVDHDAPFWI